jgi:hypothetical protein
MTTEEVKDYDLLEFLNQKSEQKEQLFKPDF